eukprot:4928380-Amphidinium_carterae.7
MLTEPYPSCQVKAVCFGHDDEYANDDDWGSKVISARVSPSMVEEVETLLANEVVPKGQGWDSVPSILLRVTRQRTTVRVLNSRTFVPTLTSHLQEHWSRS